MRPDVAENMRWSTKLFQEQVWPLIRQCIGGGEILLMEGRPDARLAELLDMRAGIDAWHLMQSGQIRGIASRVQVAARPFNSFTVRRSKTNGARTEYEKRREAMESDGGEIYPHLTCQAYAASKEGPVLSVGLARTRDIWAFIASGKATINEPRQGDSTFFVCPWSQMRLDYKVSTITARP